MKIRKKRGILSEKNKWQKKRYTSAVTRNKERGRFIVTTLSECFDLSNIKIIELGCGLGWLSVELARYCPNVIGIDLNEKAVNLAKSYQKTEGVHVKFEKGDASATKYPAKHFDVAIVSHLLEHAQSHDDPIREAKRILKTKGTLIIASPNKFWPIEQHFYLPFLHWLPKKIADKYVHLFNRANDYSSVTETPNYFEILHLLNEIGFSVEDISYTKLKRNILGTMLKKNQILRYIVSIFSPGWILICRKNDI